MMLIYSTLSNSDSLSTTQSRDLLADRLIAQNNNKKPTLYITMPYYHHNICIVTIKRVSC